jgi:hypothetical protein
VTHHLLRLVLEGFHVVVNLTTFFIVFLRLFHVNKVYLLTMGLVSVRKPSFVSYKFVPRRKVSTGYAQGGPEGAGGIQLDRRRPVG